MNISAAEDTFFKMKTTLNCRGRLLDLSTPAIMGIMNLTPDSFFDGGRLNDEKSIIEYAGKMLKEGADIIDIGGQSTRPGAQLIDSNEEWKRIGSAIKIIHTNFTNAVISIDTFYADVADKALQAGASIINDISGGDFDKNMHQTALENQVPYIVMHMQGNPGTMQLNPAYKEVVSDVLRYFVKKVTLLKNLGLHDIVIDPGFGFGKTVEHNFALLNNLNVFRLTDCPILAGLSRKSMITKVLNVKSKEALNGTTALNTIALMKGASILRVHDVKEAMEVKKLYLQLSSQVIFNC